MVNYYRISFGINNVNTQAVKKIHTPNGNIAISRRKVCNNIGY
jgi:hypothetical protein